MSITFRVRAIAVIAVAAASGLLAASPGSAATPETARTASVTADPVGIADVQPGTYRIRETGRPGYCMQQESKPLSEGPLVGMVPCGDSINQRWSFVTVGTLAPWRGVINGSGGCLDADRRGDRLTKVVHVIPCNLAADNGSQLWQFPEPPGVGIVCSAMRFCTARDALVLDDSNDESGGFGFRVNLWERTGGDNQNFFLERIA